MIDTLKKSAHLKLGLLSHGVDVSREPTDLGRETKEEYRALFDARLLQVQNPNLPPEIVLPGEIVAKTVFRPDSPYVISYSPSGLELRAKSSGEVLSQVAFPPRPKFYDLFTSDGVSMRQIAQVLGLDTLGIIINAYCSRADSDKICRVCNINSNNRKEKDTVRPMHQIEEAVRAAWNERAFSLINLTGGTFKEPENEFLAYLNVASMIRKVMGVPRLPGVTSFNPPTVEMTRKYASELKDANFELVTYNLEAWDKDTLRELFPGKHDLGGRDFYIESAKESMRILGRGHVGIILMVGVWEKPESIMEGCRAIAKEGILPIPVVFHSGRGMKYDNPAHATVEDILRIYRDIHSIYQKYQLVPSTRDRAAGSEKSFMNSLINEAYLGYLNK